METQTHLWALTLGVVILFGAVIKLLIDIRNGVNPIAGAEDFVDRVQANRPLIENAERGYVDHKDELIGAALRSLIEALRYSAPVTPFKLDDKVLKLIEDITTSGAPVPDQTIEISTGQPPLMPEAFSAQTMIFPPTPEGEDTVNITVNTAA